MTTVDIWQAIKPKTQTDGFVSFVKNDLMPVIGKANLVNIAKNYAVTKFMVYDTDEVIPPYTSTALIKEITDRLVGNVDFSTAKFLVIYTVEWANYLHAIHGVPAANITVVGDSKRLEVGAHAGYNTIMDTDFLSAEFNQGKDLKFDVVVGNPPFSKANEGKAHTKKVNLYPEFFSIALNLSRFILMIMPRTDNQVQQSHNKQIVENVTEIIEIDDDVFNIATSVWCLVVDKSKKKKIEDFTNKEIKNDIKWVKGRLTSSSKDWETDSGYDVIHSVQKSGPVILKTDKLKKTAVLPTTGFLVVFGITCNKSFVIESRGQMSGVNVYSVWFEDKVDADDFQNKLNIKFKEIDHLRGNMGVMTVSTLSQIDL